MLPNVDRTEFARREAHAFNARTLAEIGTVLKHHSETVVSHAVLVHARLELMEAVIRDLGTCAIYRADDGTLALRVSLAVVDHLRAVIMELDRTPV